MTMRFMIPLSVVSGATLSHRLAVNEGTSKAGARARRARRLAGRAAAPAPVFRLRAGTQQFFGGVAGLPDVSQAAAPQAGTRRCSHSRAGQAYHAALWRRPLHRVALGSSGRTWPGADRGAVA